MYHLLHFPLRFLVKSGRVNKQAGVKACAGDDAARTERHALMTWHSAAPPSLRWPLSQHSLIQSVFQRTGVSRLAHSWRPHSHQFIVAKQTAIGHSETTWKRGSIHRAGLADRRGDGGGGVLAVGQLLVARARGHLGGRVTRRGGRVHARVAPALRGRQGESLGRGLAVPSAATPRAAAGACPGFLPRCTPPVQRRLPSSPV
ncbi:unnamed protein product [Colias eurytheme]|nr:unnamed protein product [Colias eurytheme]